MNKIIENYNNKGWIKINKFISTSLVNKINYNLEKFLNKQLHKYDKRYINFVNNQKLFKYINSFHKLDDCKWIKNFSKKKKVIEIVKKLLNTKSIKLRQAEYFAKPKKKGLAAPIHQDNFFWNLNNSNALTIWIALSNSSKKNGGIYYFDTSHNYGLLPHKKSYMKGTSQKIKNIKLLKGLKKSFPNLKRGDALIHHSLIVHGSNSNKSNMSRRGVTLQFMTKKAKVDKLKAKNYEKNLLQQINSR
jgi:phytanoyl-CoA hydroxylase